MTRLFQIIVLVLVGLLGVGLAAWGGYACYSMRPDGTYVMAGNLGDDEALATCTFHPSIGSNLHRAGLAVCALAGVVVLYVSVTNLFRRRDAAT
jgi:hypothetical protein